MTHIPVGPPPGLRGKRPADDDELAPDDLDTFLRLARQLVDRTGPFTLAQYAAYCAVPVEVAQAALRALHLRRAVTSQAARQSVLWLVEECEA